VIEVRDLVVRFNAGLPTEVTPLEGLSIRIPSGQFVTVIGTNGAGKSTLLNCISGDVKPVSGRILIDGVDVTQTDQPGRALHVARVFQDPVVGTCEQLTVEENLALALDRGSRRGLMPALNKARRERFASALQALGLGLERKLTDPLSSLSGGQRQVVSLLMATMAPCRLLLLDEHTAALDPRTAEFVVGMSRQIAATAGLTVLMVTHSMQQALELGDRTVMLHGGKIIFDVQGEARRGLTVRDLLAQFEQSQQQVLADDTLLLG